MEAEGSLKIGRYNKTDGPFDGTGLHLKWAQENLRSH